MQNNLIFKIPWFKYRYFLAEMKNAEWKSVKWTETFNGV